MEELPRRVVDRVAGKKYMYNGIIRIWDGKELFCQHYGRTNKCKICKTLENEDGEGIFNQRKRLNNEKFAKRGNKKHNNEYDYSKVNYKANDIKVQIIHKKCGLEFPQTPHAHLAGARCSHCYTSYKKTNEEFIEQARKIHGNKYDYSKVDYTGTDNDVTLIHKKCGREFPQTPYRHLKGMGCKFCSSMKSEKMCLEILEEAMDVEFSKQRPKFLEGLEYDCFNKKLNLALEYNSIIHYKFIEHFHKTEERFNDVLKRDKKKLELSEKNNINLIIVPYQYSCSNREKLKQFIHDELERLEYIIQITLQ